jgi:hypothetical protein
MRPEERTPSILNFAINVEEAKIRRQVVVRIEESGEPES